MLQIMKENLKENNIKIQFDTNPDDTNIIYSETEDIVESMLAPQDIVVISRIEDDVVLHVNQAFITRLKQPSNGIIGKKINEINFLSNAEDQDKFFDILKHSNAFKSFETYINRSDGFRIPVILSGGKIQFNDEESIFVALRDISPIRQAERNLKESEIKYRTLFEQTHSAILLENEKSQIIDSNNAATELFGYTSEELVTLKSTDLLLRKEEEQIESNGYQSHLKEQIAKHKNEKTFWVESSTTPLEMEGTLLFLTMVWNINEKHKLEDQLQQAAKMETVGRLTGSVAHDFNNVLTIIEGFSELALSTVDRKEQVYNYLCEINKAAIKAESLIRQLMNFSRKQTPNLSIVNVNEIINNLRKLIDRVIGENLELIIDVPNNEWNIKADANQIEQIILNLVINARDAMPVTGTLMIKSEKKRIEQKQLIEFNLKKPGDYIILSVSDTGFGIDPKLKRRIFEPFFTTKEQNKGTGLGLATVRKNIVKLGGGISVSSKKGKGTTFRICLPQRSEQTQIIDKSSETENQIIGHETILVVEDQDELRKVVSQALRLHGYNVLESGNGHEALELCDQWRDIIDLVVTDVIMPNINGRELVEVLREKYPSIKYLFMSGYNEEIIGKYRPLFTAKTFLQKPFTPLVLLKKIREVINN